MASKKTPSKISKPATPKVSKAAASAEAGVAAVTTVRNSAIPKVSPIAAAAAAVAPAASRKPITHDVIAVRAYELSLSGFGGSQDDHWFQAERELLAA